MEPNQPFKEKSDLDDITLKESIDSGASERSASLSKTGESVAPRPTTNWLSLIVLALSTYNCVSLIWVTFHVMPQVFTMYRSAPVHAFVMYWQVLWLFIGGMFLKFMSHGIWFVSELHHYSLDAFVFLLGCMLAFVLVPFYLFHIVCNKSLKGGHKLAWSGFVLATCFFGIPIGFLVYWYKHIRSRKIPADA